MALFVNRQTHELHPLTDELLEQVAQLVEQRGIEAWFSLDPAALLGDEAEDYKKLPDTLDVWLIPEPHKIRCSNTTLSSGILLICIWRGRISTAAGSVFTADRLRGRWPRAL